MNVFEAHCKRWAQPCFDVAPNLEFVPRSVGVSAHQNDFDLAKLLLDDLRFLHVQGVFEEIIQTRDSRTFRRKDVVVVSPFNALQSGGMAAARTSSVLLPDRRVANFVTDKRESVAGESRGNNRLRRITRRELNALHDAKLEVL